MTVYTDIDSTNGEVQLRFTVSGPRVRVTARHIDGFDADFDIERILGDFNLEVLRHRLAGLDTHTGAIPTVQASRPGRRKPRRWWQR